MFSPNAEKCRKNVDQNNSEYEHFLRSDKFQFFSVFEVILPAAF